LAVGFVPSLPMRLVILILLLSLQADAFGQQRAFRERRSVLNTEASVLVYAASRDEAQPFLDAAFAEMQRVESVLIGSELFGEGELPYSSDLGEEMARLLNRAFGWASLSAGAYDPTAGVLNELWGHADSPPSDSLLQAARRQAGWRNVSLDILTSEIRFQQAGMRLDGTALGQGFALDAAARVLSEAGSGPALLSIGGHTYRALDPPPGQTGWLINVNDPSAEGTLSSAVRLSNAALSTFPGRGASSEAGLFSFPDPRTGRPAVVSTQATIVAGDATDAAILAAMVFVLGPDASEAILAEVPGVKAWIIHPAAEAPEVRSIRWTATNQNP
jgi:thiamine biosynthesis lipoprotein